MTVLSAFRASGFANGFLEIKPSPDPKWSKFWWTGTTIVYLCTEEDVLEGAVYLLAKIIDHPFEQSVIWSCFATSRQHYRVRYYPMDADPRLGPSLLISFFGNGLVVNSFLGIDLLRFCFATVSLDSPSQYS